MTESTAEAAPTREPDPVPAAYRAWLTATAGLADTTMRTYTGHLADYSRWWRRTHPDRRLEEADATDVEAYLAHLAARGLQASTRRTALHALRSYYRWRARQNTTVSHAGAAANEPGPLGRHRDDNPAALVRRPRVPKPGTVIYTRNEADAILTSAAGTTSANPADAPPRVGLHQAVLATLRWTGVRASELCHLQVSDLDLDQDVLHVTGKGSKHRWIPLPPPLVPLLADYLTAARAFLVEHADGPVPKRLFLNPAAPSLRLEPRALLAICRKHGNAAGVPRSHTPMRWRHTFATHTLASGGVDLHSLAKLLGHASVTTTERYLHLDTGDLSRAVQRAYQPRAHTTPD